MTLMNSGCLANSLAAAGLLPFLGCEVGGFAGFHGGQAGENVFEVISRYDAEATAVFHDGVEDCGFLAGGFVADEQPVLGSKLRRANGVFDEVVVDLDAPIAQIGFEVGPLVESVGDGFS